MQTLLLESVLKLLRSCFHLRCHLPVWDVCFSVDCTLQFEKCSTFGVGVYICAFKTSHDGEIQLENLITIFFLFQAYFLARISTSRFSHWCCLWLYL